jgi:hypothetical protein
MTVLLRRLGRGDVTVHGFRSSFRDWAGETTHHALMEDWAEFCTKAPSRDGTPPEPQEPQEAQEQPNAEVQDGVGAARPIAGLPFLPEKYAAWLFEEMEANLGRAEAERLWKQEIARRPGRPPSNAGWRLYPGFAHWLVRERTKNPDIQAGTVMRNFAEHVYEEALREEARREEARREGARREGPRVYYGNSAEAIAQALRREHKLYRTVFD